MADHSKPVTTDTYSGLLQALRDIADEQAQLFDPATTSPTNLPANTIRWNSAVDKFQKWSGSAWNTLTSAIKMAFAADAPCSIAANSTSPALTITQTGTGNTLVVEDASGDSTPFVIDANGTVINGYTSARSSAVGGAAITPALQQVGGAANSSAIGVFGFATNPGIHFAKSNGTFSSPTTAASGNIVGRVSAAAHDGAGYVEAGNIRFEVDGTPGTNDMPGRIIFSTTPDGGSSPVEAMRFTSGQGVQITRTTVTAPTAADGNVFSGTYTPSLTNSTNIAASTAVECQYVRVGNVVTVSGQVSGIAMTAASGTATVLRMSLPIASNFSSSRNVGGSAVFYSVASRGTAAAVYADITSDVAVFDWVAPTTTTAQAFTFSFTYQVL